MLEEVIPLVAGLVGTEGAVVSFAAVVVNVEAPEYADLFPAASFANTLKLCMLPAENPEAAYDVVVTLIAEPLSIEISYPVTATLSVAADQESVAEVCVIALVDKPAGTEGAVVSAAAMVAALILLE